MYKLPLILTILFTLSTLDFLGAEPFHLTQDTLILKTSKHEGYGLFEGGYWRLHIAGIDEYGEVRNSIPEGIYDVQLGQQTIDFKVPQYQRLKADQHEYLAEFLRLNYPARIDTAHLPSPMENALSVIIGRKDGERVFIVDENGNQNYGDDPIRPLRPMNAEMQQASPVKCHYQIYNGRAVIRDSGWVYVGLGSDDEVRISVAQHLRSSYSFGGQQYEFQVISWIPFAGFGFDSPKISISGRNGIQKDSLLFSEQLELGEYLQLGETYYRFADVANDGSTITLIQEADVSDKIGTLPGFIAPDFSAVSTAGDSVTLRDYRGQYLLLTNITACWSKKMSYEYYKELWEDRHDKMEIIAIDESPNALEVNIDDLGLEGKFIIGKDNPSIKRTYREDYCSRVCFLIDPNGQIVDRFEIADWQEALAKHFR